MGSPDKIRALAERIQGIKSKMSSSYSAVHSILMQVSMLESVLGFNFSKNILESDDSNANGTDTNGTEIDKEINKNIKKDINDGSWKTCVVSRSDSQRKRYCEENYNNPIFQQKCQKNFCTECCEANVDPIYKNVVHVCKKTCFRATIAASSNNEYKNICLNSPDSNSNIFGYCDSKMQSFSEVQKDACKLDMCNLCCVTMDAMKSKNYSMESLKRCYRDCNNAYNHSDLESFGKKPDDCKEKEFDPKEITNSETYKDLPIMKTLIEKSTDSQHKNENSELNRLSELYD